MTDRLTQLPAELFITICELVHGAKQGPYLAFVSRAFVPVARRLAFRKVAVKQYDHLQALCEVIMESQPLAGQIEMLVLDMSESRQDRGLPRTAVLSSAFRQLTRVRKLVVKASSRLAKLAVSPTPMSLPRLLRLEIDDPFHGWSNPFDPVNLRHLCEYRDLHSLTLHIDRTIESLGRYRSTSAPTPSLCLIVWLVLEGALSGNAAVPVLLGCIGTIVGLRLYDTARSDETRLPSLLRGLVLPQRVTALSLTQSIADPDPLVDAIASYTGLETVELGYGTWSRAMDRFLRALKDLTALSFTPGADVSTADLCGMLQGPNKLNQLRCLELDNLWTPDSPDAVDEVVGWSPSFTLDGVVEVVSLADEAGVELRGLAVDLAREKLEHREACATNNEAAQGRGA